MENLEELLKQLPNGIFISNDGEVYFIEGGKVKRSHRPDDNPSTDLIGGNEDPK